MSKHFLRGYIVKVRFIHLLICLFLGSFSASLALAADDLVTIKPVRYTPQLARPHVFPLNGVKYTHYKNYLHWWIDRPLFFDRSTRNETADRVMTFPSYKIGMKSALAYELDGYAILVGTAGMVSRYLTAVDFTDRIKPKGFTILPELATGGLRGKNIEALVAYQAKALKKALASPSAMRVKGKIVVASYGADRGTATPDVWQRVFARHRKRFGDKFIFILDCRKKVRVLHSSFKKNKGRVTKAALKEFQDHMRGYLAVSDGIMFGGSNHMGVMPERRLDDRFYEKCLIPAMVGVMEEKANDKKFLALGAAIGYANHRSGSTQHEDGTWHLRRSFEIAAAARPDFIILNEWSEFNENTCIMPTVANSTSTQRILRYYMTELKGKPQTPQSGDDLAIPNLIVSTRRILKSGRPLEIELLNVPDGKGADYSVELSLKDLGGKVVHKFSKKNFGAAKLKEYRLVIPSERLSLHPVVRPSVVITTADGRARTFEDGLHYIRLRATWNWDYKWVKMPLRDLCAAKASALRVERAGDNATFTASIQCDEELASVEVMQDGYEVAAVDVKKEYPDRESHMLVRVRYVSSRQQPFKGTLRVKGSSFKMYPSFVYKTTVRGDTVSVNYKANISPRQFMLAIPRAHLAKGVLEVNFNLVKANISLKDLAAKGIYGIAGKDGFHMTVEDYDRLPDIPTHVDRKSVAFGDSFPIAPATSLYHLRAITKSGKVYRSAPVFAGELDPPTRMNVYSFTKHRAVTVAVPANDIPDLRYEFTPKYGAMLTTPAGRDWHGELGGGADSRGPFHRGAAAYPKKATDASPEWVTEDGKACLKFDGVGNVVTFPIEIVPSGSFTMAFEIKPTDKRDTILWNSYSRYVGSLQVRIVKGKLVVIWRDQNLTTHKLAEFGIGGDTGLTIPLNKWSKVEISYNLKRLRARVNGKAGRDIPCTAPGFSFAAGAFGGHGRNSAEYFKGYLRAFRVRHRAEF
jgi:hypothetical protein